VPAYKDFGLREFTADWPWCPLWFYTYSEVTIDGESPHVALSRAQQYREKGALDGLIPKEWTPALFDGLQIMDRLDYEEW